MTFDHEEYAFLKGVGVSHWSPLIMDTLRKNVFLRKTDNSFLLDINVSKILNYFHFEFPSCKT